MTAASHKRTLVPLAEAYFDLGHYRRLHALVQDWMALGEVPADRLLPAETHATICRLLFLEARLLDASRLFEWLALFTDDCVYWLPTDVTGADAAATVTWEMNDRRRLEERVERLATGRAFSQAPPTRTTHLYTNIETMRADANNADGNEAHVLCQFLIHTNLDGRVSQRAGWNGYVLRQTEAGWRIVLKRINMFDADMPQNNNSFTL
jgi:benzoate/toluate 1,2-dioxygenase beta subunit